MCPLPNFEPVCCSMSGSYCFFLTCIQVSQEAGKVVWYSHLFKISYYYWRASLVAQMGPCLPAMWETWIQSLGWEDPL